MARKKKQRITKDQVAATLENAIRMLGAVHEAVQAGALRKGGALLPIKRAEILAAGGLAVGKAGGCGCTPRA